MNETQLVLQMEYSDPNKTLMYNFEVLSAKYEIKEYYLKNIVQEIYENVGQRLSLLRVQLSMLAASPDTLDEKVIESGELTGQVIRDLRGLCKWFDPETEYLEANGFLQALQHELQLLDFDSGSTIETKGRIQELASGTELIVYRMLQEILILVKKAFGKNLSVKISYAQKAVSFSIRYTGRKIDINQSYPDVKGIGHQRLSLLQRAEFLGGSFSVHKKKTGQTEIELIIPL